MKSVGGGAAVTGIDLAVTDPVVTVAMPLSEGGKEVVVEVLCGEPSCVEEGCTAEAVVCVCGGATIVWCCGEDSCAG